MPATLEAGRQAAACWGVRRVDGHGEEDFASHFDTAERARGYARDYNADRRTDPWSAAEPIGEFLGQMLVAYQLERPCIEWRCEGCDETVEEFDHGSTLHVDTLDEMCEAAEEWRFNVRTGQVWCPSCVGTVRFCRRCGCTDDEACEGGCWWVEEHLCSRCDGVPAEQGTLLPPPALHQAIVDEDAALQDRLVRLAVYFDRRSS